MKHTVKGVESRKIVIVECDYDSFLNHFYGVDEEPVQDENGRYLVDDETIEVVERDYPEVIKGG